MFLLITATCVLSVLFLPIDCLSHIIDFYVNLSHYNKSFPIMFDYNEFRYRNCKISFDSFSIIAVSLFFPSLTIFE